MTESVPSREVELSTRVIPEGILYEDKSRRADRGYARLGIIVFSTLMARIEDDCPDSVRDIINKDLSDLRPRVGEEYEISHSGETVTLGYQTREYLAFERQQREEAERRWAPFIAQVHENGFNYVHNSDFERKARFQGMELIGDAGDWVMYDTTEAGRPAYRGLTAKACVEAAIAGGHFLEAPENGPAAPVHDEESFSP